jgi:hypothetical protein
MKIRLNLGDGPRTNIRGYTDRRGPRELAAARAIDQARADQAIEELWRERVRRNEGRRLLRDLNHVPAMLRRQAS